MAGRHLGSDSLAHCLHASMIVARVPGHNLLRVVGRAAQAAFAESSSPVLCGRRMMEWSEEDPSTVVMSWPSRAIVSA